MFLYFFVLCMEWLGYSFYKSILESEWCFIRLSKFKSNFLYLFFADDLVIFSSVNVVNINFFMKFFSNFCEISGYKVNVSKMNVFFFKGVNMFLSSEINDMFGFYEVDDLGNYFSVLLFYSSVIKSILEFLVESVYSSFFSWDVKCFFFISSVILAQFVLLFILSYFM